VLSVVGGFVGLPMQEGGHLFARWLAPVFAAPRRTRPHELPATEWMLIASRSSRASIGIAVAFRLYLRSPASRRAARALAASHRAARTSTGWTSCTTRSWCARVARSRRGLAVLGPVIVDGS
jgi:hypothetical protein